MLVGLFHEDDTIYKINMSSFFSGMGVTGMKMREELSEHHTQQQLEVEKEGMLPFDIF